MVPKIAAVFFYSYRSHITKSSVRTLTPESFRPFKQASWYRCPQGRTLRSSIPDKQIGHVPPLLNTFLGLQKYSYVKT
jgi:hypothetical protein